VAIIEIRRVLKIKNDTFQKMTKNRMKRQVLIYCLVQIFAVTVFAQTQYRGIVIDDNDLPILEALIIHLDNKGYIVGSLQVDTTGTFVVHNMDFQNGRILVTALGYESKEIRQSENTIANKIVLHRLSMELDDVVVTANSSSITQRSDRLVFNINNENLTRGNNTFELLRMAPLVQINNDIISIVGRGSVSLYINGRRTNLSQDALRSYLQSLPAESIASIEVITNPGARFSTSGNQGVINLILKRNEAEGLRGTARVETVQTQKTNSQNGSVHLDYQREKFNITGSAYIDNSNSYFENTTRYYFHNVNKNDVGKNEINNTFLFAGGNVRVDYHLSERQTIGALFDISHSNRKNNSETNTTFYNAIGSQVIDSIFDSHNQGLNPATRLLANLNYRARFFETGSTFTIDIDYLRNNRDETVFNEFYRRATDILPEHKSIFSQRSIAILDNYSARAEYNHVFNNKHSLASGIEVYRTISNSDFTHAFLVENQYILDPSRSNSFDYNETFFSCYLSYNWKLNDKISGRAELKAERAIAEGIQRVTDERVERRDFDLLPNLSILYEINPDNRLSYNLLSFAGRPLFSSLNTFRFYLNPNTYREYNPDLKTINAYIQDVTYTLKRQYIFRLSYSHFINPTNNFLIPVDDQYTKLINANFKSLQFFDFGFSWNSSFFDNRLSMNTSTNGRYGISKGTVETIIIDNRGFSYDFSLSSNYALSRENNWYLTFSGFYRSKIKFAQENIGNRFSTSLGVRKVFANDMSLNFGIRNLFTNHYDIREKATPEYKYYIRNRYYSTRAHISLSVPFGNQKTKGAQGRRTSSSGTSERLNE
jgi:hypothetical protein